MQAKKNACRYRRRLFGRRKNNLTAAAKNAILRARSGGLPFLQFAETGISPGRRFFFTALPVMHLLYLDDAGSISNTKERNFVLGGICIFERQAYWLQQELERIVRGVGNPEDLELHGSAIHARRGPWRRFDRQTTRQLICDGLAAAKKLRGDWRLFGAVVDKKRRLPEDPVEYAFEQVCSRFDYFLGRRRERAKTGRPSGLIVFDKTTRETRLQELAADFRKSGHRWGDLHYIAEVPLFVDSRATRLVQYADLVCYALWRKFEKNDPEFFNVIADCFDNPGGLHRF
jgi:hypothetical protein